jgi:hypothetical protein
VRPCLKKKNNKKTLKQKNKSRNPNSQDTILPLTPPERAQLSLVGASLTSGAESTGPCKNEEGFELKCH